MQRLLRPLAPTMTAAVATHFTLFAPGPEVNVTTLTCSEPGPEPLGPKLPSPETLQPEKAVKQPNPKP